MNHAHNAHLEVISINKHVNVKNVHIIVIVKTNNVQKEKYLMGKNAHANVSNIRFVMKIKNGMTKFANVYAKKSGVHQDHG